MTDREQRAGELLEKLLTFGPTYKRRFKDGWVRKFVAYQKRVKRYLEKGK